MIIPFALSFAVLLLFLKYRNDFIVFAPLLIVLEPMLGTRSRVEAGALVHYVIAACLLLCSIQILYTYRPIKRIRIPVIYVYIFAIFIHFPLGGVNQFQLKNMFVLLADYIVLPASLIFFDSESKLRLLLKIALFSLASLVVYIIISSIMRYGYSPYRGISYIYLGNYDLFRLSCLAIFIILFPAIRFYTSQGILTSTLAVIGFVILVLITKRNFIIMTTIPLIIYFMSMQIFKDIRKSLLPTMFFILFGFIAIQYSSDMIVNRYYSRENAFQQNVVDANRTRELFMYGEILKAEAKPIKFVLFGRNFFDTAGNFDVLDRNIGDSGRNWHSGMSSIIYGLGLFGAVAFITLWGNIFVVYKRGFGSKPDFERKLLSTQTLMIISCTFLISTLEAISSLHSGAIPLIFLGAFLSYRYQSA